VTVTELAKRLAELEAEGLGAMPAMILFVEQGLPIAIDVKLVTQGDPADGKVVWLHPGEEHLPGWMS
jgi:hypothetical protein